MASNLFYPSEMVDYLKENALDLIRKELNIFAEDTSEIGSIAFRNRVAGIIDMIDHIEATTKEIENNG